MTPAPGCARNPWCSGADVLATTTTLSLLAAIAVFCPGCFGRARPASAPSDIQFAQFSSTARTAFERGQIAQAHALYARALERARAADDAAAIADAGYNAALCLLRLREPARAEQLLIEAQHESARARKDAADIVLLRAAVARSQGRLADAVALADDVLSGAGRSKQPSARLIAHTVKGMCALDSGDVSAASVQLARARRLAPATDSAGAVAGMMHLAARIDERSDRPADAARHYDAQADYLRRSTLYPDMADALVHAGTAYRAARMPGPAADRFYRAARSAAARGDTLGAAASARLAADAAAEAGDVTLRDRADGLLTKLAAATQPAPAAPAPNAPAPPPAAPSPSFSATPRESP